MAEILKGKELFKGINTSSKEEVVVYSKKCKLSGGFLCIGSTKLYENKDALICNLSPNGLRVFFIIMYLIQSTKGRSATICLAPKYVFNQILTEPFPSGRIGLYRGIQELIQFKVIKKNTNLNIPHLYDINFLWFPLMNVENQESF